MLCETLRTSIIQLNEKIKDSWANPCQPATPRTRSAPPEPRQVAC